MVSRPNSSRVTLVRLGTRSSSQEGSRAIQDRIGAFALICAAIAGTFLVVYPLLGSLLPQGGKQHRDWALAWHAAGVGMLLAVWAVARSRRALSTAALAALDAGSVAFSSAAFTAMALSPRDAAALQTCLLTAMCLVITRAIMVPSEASRTLWVSAIGMLPVPIASWIGMNRSPLVGFGQELSNIANSGFVGLYVVDRVVWCTAAVMIAGVASRVIYGLREEVREAQQLGQYTLEERIGEGGMGTVYRARHLLLRRPTAIKLVRQERLGKAQLQRFEREVQLTSQLTHPNTISIFDYGHTPDGVFYYAMEYLDGYNLDELVERYGAQPSARVIHILAQACGALSEAHERGLIHRDIKPANIFLCERGGEMDAVKVLDFGLVKDVAEVNPALSDVQTVTGTPLFMSPEAITMPNQVEATSDIYALGLVGYYLLTGTHVFSGATIVEVCFGHVHSEPEPPSARVPGVASDLEAVLLRCLRKDPKARPNTARALRDELLSCRDAGGWSEALARQWWQGRRRSDSIDPRAPRAPAQALATVQIELRPRLAPAPHTES